MQKGDLKYENSRVVSGRSAGWNGLNAAVMNILSPFEIVKRGLAGKRNVGRGKRWLIIE